MALGTSAVAAAVGVAGVSAWLWAIRLAGGFVAGVLVWLVVRGVAVTPRVARRANAVALIAIVELVVVVYWAASAPSTAAVPAATRLLLAVPLFPVLLGALALGDPARGVAGRLAHPVVERGGRRSYALYLVHFPVMEVALVAMTRFPAIGPHTAAAALLVPHLVALALVLAAVAHRWVEEPARRWMLARRPQVSTVDVPPVGDATPIPFRPVGSSRRGAPDALTGGRPLRPLRSTERRGGSHVVPGAPAAAQMAPMAQMAQ
jgi:peptidoglycan/LPS O-acetylase OafA/YrhL